MLSAPVCPHANMQLHLSALVQMGFPTLLCFKAFPVVWHKTEGAHPISNLTSCSTFTATAFIHPSSVLGGVGFLWVLLWLFCSCFCFVVDVVLLLTLI